jgi:hypothetical protein
MAPQLASISIRPSLLLEAHIYGVCRQSFDRFEARIADCAACAEQKSQLTSY